MAEPSAECNDLVWFVDSTFLQDDHGDMHQGKQDAVVSYRKYNLQKLGNYPAFLRDSFPLIVPDELHKTIRWRDQWLFATILAIALFGVVDEIADESAG